MELKNYKDKFYKESCNPVAFQCTLLNFYIHNFEAFIKYILVSFNTAPMVSGRQS